MPILQIELTDEEYDTVLSFPAEERRSKIVAAFATAPNPPPPAPLVAGGGEADYRPLPYFDGDEVVTANGRRPRRPWDGKTVWDGITTNPDDFPDFDDLAAEQMAGMAEGFLDADAGRVRDGKLVMQEMRERLARGEFNPHPPAQSGREYRNGK